MKKIYTAIICLVMLFTSNSITAQNKIPSHDKWTNLLKKYVNKKGFVDYIGFKKDMVALDEYLQLISKEKPENNWTKEDKLAYWINAYNAYTIQLILKNYPVKSIKDLNPGVSIVYVNTIWDKKFFSIGGEEMSLNHIENKILRKMGEPRIHFAINCASISCPKLLNEAFEGKKIETQLTARAKDFLSDKTRNEVIEDKPKLSSIFKWFGGDFEINGKSKIDFINQYSSVKINADANINYLTYNWKLNEQ